MTIHQVSSDIVSRIPAMVNDSAINNEGLVERLIRPLLSRSCRWKTDGDTCSWDTSCDNKYQFMYDGPKENDYKFCPGCGGRIEL